MNRQFMLGFAMCVLFLVANAGAVSNDVWSFADGVHWTLANATAAFSPPSHHSTMVYDNRIPPRITISPCQETNPSQRLRKRLWDLITNTVLKAQTGTPLVRSRIPSLFHALPANAPGRASKAPPG
jgi:hypothetical protein